MLVPHARDGARGESRSRVSGAEHILSLSPRSRGARAPVDATAPVAGVDERAVGQDVRGRGGGAAGDERLPGQLGGASQLSHRGRVGGRIGRVRSAGAGVAECRQLFSVQVARRLSTDRVFSHEGSWHVVEALPAGVSLRAVPREGDGPRASERRVPRVGVGFRGADA